MSGLPDFIDWIWDPFEDDDESSSMGFNDPVQYEPGDDDAVEAE